MPRKRDSLYRRGDIWWVRFTSPSGRRVQRSTKTTNRREAEEFEARLKSAAWRAEQLREKPRRTWKETTVRYIREKDGEIDSLKDVLSILRRLDPWLGECYLDEITRDLIDRIKGDLLKRISKSTVNRYLQVVRAVLRMAALDWEWGNTVPRIRLYKEPKRRIRYLTPEQVRHLLEELPDHLRSVVGFALATGLRERNITQLEWSQVDLARSMAWIHADQAKAERPISVPLNGHAMVILRQQVGKHPVRIFTFGRKPFDRAGGKGWRKALDRAGLRAFHDPDSRNTGYTYPSRPLDEYVFEDFRFHDLRHTWASWHIQAGTRIEELKELGGWASLEMVQRYAHLSADHLRDAAERIVRPNDFGTKLVQSDILK